MPEPNVNLSVWAVCRVFGTDLLIFLAYLLLNCAIHNLKRTAPTMGSVLFFSSWAVLFVAFFLSNRPLFGMIKDSDIRLILNGQVSVLVFCAPTILYAWTNPCRIPLFGSILGDS